MSYFGGDSTSALPTLHPFTAILASDWCLPLYCSVLWEVELCELILLDHLIDWLVLGFGNGKCHHMWMRAREEKSGHSFLCSFLNSSYVPVSIAPISSAALSALLQLLLALHILFLPLFLKPQVVVASSVAHLWVPHGVCQLSLWQYTTPKFQ